MDLEHYKYVTVDDAVNLCQPGRWLAKVSLKHAYRSVGTHPDGWRDTGMSYLYDKRLPFGDRASPLVFHRFAQAISRMMARRGYTVLAYLDDFLFIEPTQRLCKGNFWHPVSRLPAVNWSKVVYTAQCLIFLGAEIDTVQFELRLSDDRLSVLPLLKVTSSKRIFTKLHLQRLLCKLNLAARIVRGGAHFWGVLLPWQNRLNALTMTSIQT